MKSGMICILGCHLLCCGLHHEEVLGLIYAQQLYPHTGLALKESISQGNNDDVALSKNNLRKHTWCNCYPYTKSPEQKDVVAGPLWQR